VSPASAQGSAAEKELLFGGFGGTSPRAMQTYVVRAFEKKFGVHVTYVAGTSTEMLAKVRAQGGQPQIDIIWMTETTHDQASAAGVSEKLDPKIVTNPADLTPSARMPGDAGVGMGMQALAIEYNTKVFQQRGWAAPTSWSDLWDPKFKGHVVAYNVRSATQRLRRIHQRAEWRHHHRSRPGVVQDRGAGPECRGVRRIRLAGAARSRHRAAPADRRGTGAGAAVAARRSLSA
jgi:hypothetical protein